jgi:hypothetical protein
LAGAPGASLVSSQVASSRRTSLPSRSRVLSAVVTVGRRAPILAGRQSLCARAQSVHEHGVDLGKAHGRQREGTPEHREMRIGEDLPADLHAEQMRFLLAGPGPKEVSGTEQLGADGVLEHDLACDDAVDHQQPDILAADRRQPVSRPLASRQLEDAHHELCPRLGEAVEIQRCAELRVEIEQRAGT